MTYSINTNIGALIALQNLSQTSSDLTATQERISTGLKVASAKDNGAIWAIAQTQRAQVSADDAVLSSLSNGKSIVDVTLSAGTQITDLLNQMKGKALAASDATISDTSRAQYASEFVKLAKSYANTIASGSFNGVNLMDAGAGSVSALGDSTGSIQVTSAHVNLNVNSTLTAMKAFTTTAGAFAGTAPAAADTVTATAAAWTGATAAADAAADMAKIDTALTTVTTALSGFGVDSKSMSNQSKLVTKLNDSLNAGISNLVDADMAKESATLQSLQAKQQLGVQALSLANQSTNSILALFR